MHTTMFAMAHSLPREETESSQRNEEESEVHPDLRCLLPSSEQWLPDSAGHAKPHVWFCGCPQSLKIANRNRGIPTGEWRQPFPRCLLTCLRNRLVLSRESWVLGGCAGGHAQPGIEETKRGTEAPPSEAKECQSYPYCIFFILCWGHKSKSRPS